MVPSNQCRWAFRTGWIFLSDLLAMARANGWDYLRCANCDVALQHWRRNRWADESTRTRLRRSWADGRAISVPAIAWFSAFFAMVIRHLAGDRVCRTIGGMTFQIFAILAAVRLLETRHPIIWVTLKVRLKASSLTNKVWCYMVVYGTKAIHGDFDNRRLCHYP